MESTRELLGKLGSNKKETFGFKSHKSPPPVSKLAEFESDLLTMFHNIEFRPVRRKTKNKVNRINSEAKTIAEKLELDDKIQQLQETEAFILVKDLKEGFPNSPSFRLINPSKSEIGKISKHILDKINKSLLSNTKVNQ